MVLRQFIPSAGILAGVLSPALVVFASVPPQQTARVYPESKVSLGFPVENRGAPSSTVGAGTRGASCIQEGRGKVPLKALMPTRNNFGTTVAPNPTFFVYVPKTTAQSAEFVVVDDKKDEVYLTSLDVSGTPGVVKLSLPPTVSLEIGKNYMWQFSLICDTIDRSQDKLVRGFIQRVELSPDMNAKLKQAAPLEQAKLYAKDRIWYETVTILADLRSSKPAEWEELLKSVGLEDIAKQPFVTVAQ